MVLAPNPVGTNEQFIISVDVTLSTWERIKKLTWNAVKRFTWKRVSEGEVND